MKSKRITRGSDTETGIAFDISAEANQILTESAKRSERAKKREGKLRLEDHLKRFPDWTL
ncbi:TraY domain-containing protein [Vibrio mediterranei]|uniref:Relaxosome protein TraY n=1 Tax=Vibrio mediterranei TaxID=689 RepID=A0ABX5D9P2_9VIBR|nr:TraY domain-containing protein [Vibrio mediterranei]PCD85530.1 TraY domain-containing protein [Vibrio mediterranei]PRQ65381.1 TraY domain-containing protein [Vibrio mediterranei]